MGKCAIHDDGVDEEFVIYDVCLVDADRDVFCAELASADFGEVNLVKRNLALDVRGEDAVDVSADSDVGGEVTGEVLVVDGIVQVRLDAAILKSYVAMLALTLTLRSPPSANLRLTSTPVELSSR